MGTMVKIRESAHSPGQAVRYARSRRRWCFRPRGLVRVLLVVVVVLNLYVLADNIIRLVKQHQEENALTRGVVKSGQQYEALKKQRDYMQTTEFLKDSAHSLGYIAPGETADAIAEEIPTNADPTVQKKRNRPCPPY